MTADTRKLIADIKTVVADTEELLKATAADTSERMKALRPKLEESLRAAKAQMLEAEQLAIEKAKAAAAATDRYAHENPWKTAGIAAAIGVLVGVVIGRGGRD
ncbi:MAG: DUF883 domain-containing protein [Betaproteobacteria bacterium]|jgi:ElaB/YqjD/DUF883 family membrane-anchored ribosome-binding protein|nr:DUF883 domain-containing protein [Betaproteobacteria bacterium]